MAHWRLVGLSVSCLVQWPARYTTSWAGAHSAPRNGTPGQICNRSSSSALYTGTGIYTFFVHVFFCLGCVDGSTNITTHQKRHLPVAKKQKRKNAPRKTNINNVNNVNISPVQQQTNFRPLAVAEDLDICAPTGCISCVCVCAFVLD